MESFASRVPARNLYIVATLIIGVIAATFSIAVITHNESFDDAYITYRFAENLAAGHGLRWNPEDAEPIYGASSLPHCFTIAGGIVLGLEPRTTSMIVQVAAHIAVSLLAVILVRGIAGLGAGLLAALCFPAVFYGQGLEIEAYIAFILSALFLYRRGDYFWAGLIGGATVVIRLDGAVVLAAIGLSALLEPERRSSIPKLVAGAAIPILPWLIAATIYFGNPLPHSMQAKVVHSFGHEPWRFDSLFNYWLGQPIIPILLLPAVVGSLYSLADRNRALAFWLLFYIAEYKIAGMPNYAWYFAAPMVGICILAFMGFGRLIELGRDEMQPALAAAAAIGATVVLLFAANAAQHYVRNNAGELPKSSPHMQAATWLRENTDRDDTILAFEIGKVGYFAERRIVDMFGLVSPEVVPYLREGGFTDVVRNTQFDYVFILRADVSLPEERNFDVVWEHEDKGYAIYRPAR
ncbi:MAG: hypothetical protein SGI88_07610 [Candidatus Hydrogenedentes bacterium]|nr:hypothetical protein [Candidatus Hydrogenedentota bacterium]